MRPKKRKLHERKVIAIIIDGKCEQWYFQLLKKHEKLPNIKIVPELPARRKLRELYNLVIEKRNEHYDKIIWLVDFDTLIKEDRESPKGKGGKIQEFLGYLNKLKQFKNIIVLINSPCLEIWYLLHFERSTRKYSNCNSVIKILKKKKKFINYEKSEKYYKMRDIDIYKKLKPFQKDAIKNAKSLGDFNINYYDSAKAEIYKVFELLNIS